VPLRRAAIETQALTRRFDDRVAVDGLTLSVERGEIFGFLGPNGAGKTTTLRMLSTLLRPTEGTAHILGHPVAGEPMAVRRLLGVMTERPGLYDRMTIDANLRFWAEAHGVDDIDRAIGRALDMVGLADRRHDKAGALSKGLRQRAALARTIVHDPPVLLLDEPSSGLDPAAAVHVEDMIRGLVRNGATVFLNTHRLAEAQRLCDRVAILNTKLVALGTPSELRQQLFGNTVTVRLDGVLSPALAERLRSLTFVAGLRAERTSFDCTLSDVRRDTPELVAAIVAAGGRVLEVQAAGDLEQVYLDLVGRPGESSPASRTEAAA
jgi:ABC-2 type transport system ATP-binding protein